MKKSQLHWLIPATLAVLGLSPALALSANKVDKAQNANRPAEAGWHLRLTVATPDQRMKDPGNVLGQLPDSVDGSDSHDLPELMPPYAHYLTLVFPHPEWGMESSYYASDFHATGYAQPDEWLFEVRSDQTKQDLVLSWSDVQPARSSTGEDTKGARPDNLATLINRMWLEDVATGEQVSAIGDGSLRTYAFNMDGNKVRVFRWVLQGGNGHMPEHRRHNPKAWIDSPAGNSPNLPNAPGFQR